MISTRFLIRSPSSFRSLSTTKSIASSSIFPEQSISADLNSTPELLPYHVRRTNSANLPVFGEIKNGGERYLTIIRKIDGDVMALKHDISEHIPQAEAFVKVQARQVVLKGNWVKETKEWLSTRGF